ILMARRAGLVGILTLSGVTRPEELDWADVKPDYVIESLAELPELDARLDP
ncbi:MAG TPA: HAD family hydrolase, partial [Oceanithermus profundus]|nr:HAD family hydrolase [Oceanithermus profundus]